ncbi:MAG: DNA-processing protein DprA [Clostridia bacterium]|nr:DNA-processing protein DprA [Clostridia bacterium]
MKDRLFDIWFSLRVGIANREFTFVLEQYENTYQVFTADEAELEKLPCGEGLKRALGDKDLTEACRIMEYCDKYGVGLLFYQDAGYPASLRAIPDPPVMLYWQGQLPDFAHLLCISVVGTRKMSEYGKRMAYKIGYELAAADTVVISGMALGIDSVATAGALRAGGRTVAVLGSGIDITYPPAHTGLRQVIQKHGAVITEFPPATRPEPRNFPIRNRIISGLSQGTVIVEADLKSGALITAKTALVQGRNIFAVPGNVGDENTSGTNQLIRDGAIVALDARDILQNYEFLYSDVLRMGRLPAAEKQSEPDEDALAELGVCAAVTLPGRTPPRPLVPRQKPQDTPPSAPRRHREDTRPISRQPAPVPPKEPAAEKGTVPRTPVTDSDRSQAALDSLTDTQRAVFEALPLDHSVTLDELSREGFTAGEIMAAMTVLEIKGLTVTLPGGLYQRR